MMGGSQRPIFDAANNEKRAVIIRNIAALFYGIAFMAGAVWASRIGLADILWSHPGWAVLGALAFLVLFPIVTYGGIIMLFAAKMGFLGCLLGTVVMLVLFFARAMSYGYLMGKMGRKTQANADPFYHGLIGGSPSKRTGIFSLPVKVGSSSSSGGGGSKGGGRFGGGGAQGKH